MLSFLFIAGQLYLDDEANERVRGTAQGFIAFILWGVGSLVGRTLAGKSQVLHPLAQSQGTITHDWCGIWIYPAGGAVGAVLVLFLIFFRDLAKKTAPIIEAGAK